MSEFSRYIKFKKLKVKKESDLLKYLHPNFNESPLNQMCIFIPSVKQHLTCSPAEGHALNTAIRADQLVQLSKKSCLVDAAPRN